MARAARSFFVLAALLTALAALPACGSISEGSAKTSGSRATEVGDTLDVVEHGAEPVMWLSNELVMFRRAYSSNEVVVTTVEGDVLLDLELTAPTWILSPDGREVAFSAWEPGTRPHDPHRQSSLYVAPRLLDSSPKKLFQAEGRMWVVGWTVDGGHLIVVGPETDRGAWERAFPREGGEPRDYLSEHAAKGSATVVIPPGGALPGYRAQTPLWTHEGHIVHERLSPGRTFGLWTVSVDGFLRRGGSFNDHSCKYLLSSPDGRYAACKHVKWNSWTESGEAWGTIVRLRD